MMAIVCWDGDVACYLLSESTIVEHVLRNLMKSVLSVYSSLHLIDERPPGKCRAGISRMVYESTAYVLALLIRNCFVTHLD